MKKMIASAILCTTIVVFCFVTGSAFGEDPCTLEMTPGGNVGIGTATPDDKLDVVGWTDSSSGLKINGKKAGEWGYSATVGTAGWYRIASNAGSRADALFSLRDYISGGGHSTLTFRAGIAYNDAPGMSFTVLDHSRYSTPTFTKVRILEYNTYDPQYLEVYVARTGSMDFTIYDNMQSAGWVPVNWTAGAIPSGYSAREYDVDKLFVVGDYDDRFTINRGGNVGIGTTAPSKKLDVAGDINFTGDLYKNGALFSGGGGSSYSLNAADGSPTNAVYVDNDGKVGIGTTGPGAKLDVVGNMRWRTSDGITIGYLQGDGNYTELYAYFNDLRCRVDRTADVFSWYQAGTNLMTLTGAGNLGIGTTAPAYKLEVNGTAAKPGGGSWSSTSDNRLKTNVHNLEGALDRLTQLRGVNFEWINPDEHGDQNGVQAGLIAQEVEEVFPEWVSEIEPAGNDESLVGDGEKIKTLQFPHGFNAYVIEAAKELKARTDELTVENTGLTAKVSALEAENDLLRKGLEAIMARVEALEAKSE